MARSQHNAHASEQATAFNTDSATLAPTDTAARAPHRQHFDVFLSHNGLDKPAVEELARYLVRHGIHPWLDTWNLVPGEPWQEALEAALVDCATCAVFIGLSGSGPWQNEEMRSAIDRRVAESAGRFRVIPVLLPGAERGDRSRLPTFLSRTTWVEFRRSLDEEDALHRLMAGIRGVTPGPAASDAPYGDTCPYRGLEVFDVEDALFFFGREALTDWLLEALPASPGRLDEANRFLAIIGPSGSGKSSLARAGLVAGLLAGRCEGSAEWPVVICRPGADPLEGLAMALAQAGLCNEAPAALTDLIRTLRADARALHLTTRLALNRAPHQRRVVVLVDQFEEIFTACHDESLRLAFVNNLLYAANVARGQTLVLVTLRADFYGKCAALPDLAAALSAHQLLVGPMSEHELRLAIERPAQLAGCEFEPGLVDLLVRDVQGEAGGLPLLQYALRELWFRRAGRRLTHAAYQDVGGVGGALNHAAEAIYGQFTDAERAVSQRIFLRLIQPGEGTEDTRRRTSFDELGSQACEGNLVEHVVETLADTRLLTTSADEHTGNRTVDIAHEALLRAWPRFRAWIEEDRAGLHILRRLTEAAKEWQQANRDPALLYRGARLAEAHDWRAHNAGALSITEFAFLEASNSHHTREIRRARMLKIGAAVATLATVLIGVAVAAQIAVFATQADFAKQNADRSQEVTNTLTTYTQGIISAFIPDTGVAASLSADLQAIAEADTDDARNAAIFKYENQVVNSRLTSNQARALMGIVDPLIGAGVTVPDQFRIGLPAVEAYAATGPVAAMAFAEAYGRSPTPAEAMQLARQVGWTPVDGMNGIANEQRLLDKMGVPSRLELRADWDHIRADAIKRRPVIVGTPGHYFVIDDYDPNTGAYHVGQSGLAFRDGSEWMTPSQIEGLGGTPNGALFTVTSIGALVTVTPTH